MSYMSAGLIVLAIITFLLLVGGGAATALASVALYIFVGLLLISLLVVALGWTPLRPGGVSEEDEDATLNPRGLPTDET